MKKMESSLNFRRNVREAMNARRISQRALANKLRTSQPHISKILAGEVQPSLDLADRIADAIGLPLAALVHNSRREVAEAS